MALTNPFILEQINFSMHENVKKCSISNWISASLLLKGVNIELKKNSFQKIYRPFSQINMDKFQEFAYETAYLLMKPCYSLCPIRIDIPYIDIYFFFWQGDTNSN